MSARTKLRRRQFHVGVFAGTGAPDLVGVFAAIAATEGEAMQQAWDYVRDNWTTDPARFEYHAVTAPVMRRPRRQKGREGHGQA